MAEKTEFLQAIDDAILDADSLERFINGSDSETVLTRLSAEYPTLQKALKELFENGGIAGRFKTLAELQASPLAEGDYALVADDTDDINGIYIKEGGEWIKSKYTSASKSEFYEIVDGTLPLTLNNGFIASARHSAGEGTIVVDVGYAYSQLIELPKGETLEVAANVSSNVIAISKWSAEGVFEKEIQRGTNKQDTFLYTAVEDVEYIRVCSNKNSFIDGSSYVRNLTKLSMTSLKHGIDNLKTVSNIPKPVELSWEDGYVASPTHIRLEEGTIGTGNHLISNLFEAKKDTVIKIIADATSNVSLLSRWTENGEYVESCIVGQTGEKTEFEYVVKEDIGYFRVSSGSTFSPNGAYVAIRDLNAREIINSLDIGKEGIEVNPQTPRVPVINFQFDDGNTTDATVVDIFKQHGFVCAFALMSSIDNNINEYLGYQDDGFEILSHGVSHPRLNNNDLDVSVVDGYLRDSANALRSQGFNIKGWVTPYSKLHDDYIHLVNQYYDFAFTQYLGEWDNTMEASPYNSFNESTLRLKRMSLQAETVQAVKDSIDRVINEGGMLSLYGHAIDTTMPETRLHEILTYVRTKVDGGECIVDTPYNCYKHFFSLRHSDFLNLITPNG